MTKHRWKWTGVLLLSTLIALGGKLSPPERNTALLQSLSAIKMTPGDIRLETTVEPDSFRLPIVDSVMLAPLVLPDIAESVGVKFTTDSLSRLMEHSANLLNVKYSSPVFEKASSENPWADERDIPPKLRKAMDIVLTAFQQAHIVLNDAFSNLDSLELDTLYRFADNYLTDGERKMASEANESGLEEDFVKELAQERLDERFFPIASRVNREKLLAAEALIVEAASRAEKLAAGVKSSSKMSIYAHSDSTLSGDVLYRADTPFGPFVIGGTGRTIYSGNFALIIDMGGDDSYLCAAGGTDTMLTFSVAVDIHGNDSYISGDYGLGAGRFGCGVLIDSDGNDSYRGGRFSLGSGLFGCGVLWDRRGDDTYSGLLVTEGAAFIGLGILVDGNGNDFYTAHQYAQGFGFVGGLGVLADREGNDCYAVQGAAVDVLRYSDHYLSLSQGFGYGYRPDYSGGIGILADRAGNDSYICDIFGQGASYWFALGMLYDGGGNDTYRAYQYAQGSATHLTAGVLLDVSGRDAYVSHSVSQGCGHDLAVGYLNDRGVDDDSYTIWDLSQGAGNANGIGIFVDEGGDDSYIAHQNYNVQGYGNWRREFGSIGIMLDLSGNDKYVGKGAEGSFWTSGRYGIGIDFAPSLDTLSVK